MANLYYPAIIPAEYNQVIMQEEFDKLSAVISALEVPTVTLTITYVAPARPQEGMVINADGTTWNPGGGAGLYQYLGGSWSKL